MSRLATITGVLSAVVSLGDYLFAKSFLSQWLQCQMRRDAEGWRISPTFNLLCIAMLVGLVWLVTEPSSADLDARKRLFRWRSNIVIGSLLLWFFFGPAIGDTDVGERARSRADAHAATPEALDQANSAAPDKAIYDPAASYGHTSQFTWKRPADSQPPRGWRPGDGLRAMARMIEDATGPTSPER
ncbi:MAG TPA: hypothetical protein VF278_25375 [Pirellulales bacterium]